MVPEERKKQILELLEQKNYMTVEEISGKLYVSPPTIRRDLKSMDEEGLIRRTHGGASHISSELKEFPFELRNRSNIEEKRAIGRKAMEFIKNNDHLFIDTGSSCYTMVEALPMNLELTVLTNCIPTLQNLSLKPGITIECPCGQYNSQHRSICGPDASRFIHSRYANYYFASATGISVENGVSLLTSMDLEVKKAMMSKAEKTILLMDHSKINKSYYYKAFDLSDIDILITDRELPSNLEKACRENGVEIILA